MAIDPRCEKCGNELNEPGGILFGPPQQILTELGYVEMTPKFHLCKKCFAIIYRKLDD